MKFWRIKSFLPYRKGREEKYFFDKGPPRMMKRWKRDDDAIGRYAQNIERLSVERMQKAPFVWGTSHCRYDFTGPRPVLVLNHEAPDTLYCGREMGGGPAFDDPDGIAHIKVLVFYVNWMQQHPSFKICWHRVKDWNTLGRYEDSRAWVRAYVILLCNLPWLEPLRGVFRLYGRSLIWPAYMMLEHEPQPPQPPNRQEEIAPE